MRFEKNLPDYGSTGRSGGASSSSFKTRLQTRVGTAMHDAVRPGKELLRIDMCKTTHKVPVERTSIFEGYLPKPGRAVRKRKRL
jgi:hypothetical protein